MSTDVRNTLEQANFAGGNLCARDAASIHLTRRLSDKARDVFDKPYRALVDLLHISERDAHYRLSGQRKYTAIEIAYLLRSEEGVEFLAVIMGGAKPRWWRMLGVLWKMNSARHVEAAARKEVTKILGEVLDADRSLSEAITRADTLSFQGQEQAGVQADALRALFGSQDSAVAPKGVRR